MAQVRHRPGLGLLAGLGMTLVVQSSSATIAVLQRGGRPPRAGRRVPAGPCGTIPVLLGDNIGTTVTAVLASVGQSRDAKRLAAAHTLFNLSGAAVCWLLLPQFTALVRLVSPHGPESAVLARADRQRPHPVQSGLHGAVAAPDPLHGTHRVHSSAGKARPLS